MLIGFERFIPLIFVVWTLGEIFINIFKGKFKNLVNMLMSVIVFAVIAIFELVYDIVALKADVNAIYIMDAILYLILCEILPLTGYDLVVDLIKRVTKK